MIEDWEIREAFRAEIIIVDDIPAEGNRNWQGRPFERPDNERWIRETLLVADESLTANDETRQIGSMQWDYFFPMSGNFDIKDAELKAAKVKKHFKTGTVLNHGVRCERSRLLQGRPDGAWYLIPILIDYAIYGDNS